MLMDELSTEEIERQLQLLLEVKRIVKFSHKSAPMKIRAIYELLDKVDPGEKLWDRLHNNNQIHKRKDSHYV